MNEPKISQAAKDAAISFNAFVGGSNPLLSKFAIEQLERIVASAIDSEVARLMQSPSASHYDPTTALARLVAEVEELRKDRIRLEWLETQCVITHGVHLDAMTTHDQYVQISVITRGGFCGTHYKTVRGAIDAAIDAALAASETTTGPTKKERV